MKFRLIRDAARSATLNMALDEVLSQVQTAPDAIPSLRFYQWEKPALTVGYFENVQKVAARFKADIKHLPVVRRLTGGGAVLHDQDVTFSLCAKLPNPHIPSDAKESYLKINEAVRRGLGKFYPAIDYADCKTTNLNTAGQQGRVCFDSPSCYDLLLERKKILGASQRRFSQRLLHQSTLFIPGNSDEIIQLIMEGFSDLWKAEFFVDAITDQEIEKARIVERERYLNQDWAYFPESFLREAILRS